VQARKRQEGDLLPAVAAITFQAAAGALRESFVECEVNECSIEVVVLNRLLGCAKLEC
jgi:hypothetical protein